MATTSSWNAPSGPHPVSIYYWSVQLTSSQPIQSVTLPSVGNMHIFAMAAS